MAFELPTLPYAYDSLAPYMSRETLEFHHDKHHQAYVTNGNNLVKGTGLESENLEAVVQASYQKRLAGLFNNVSQHWNHVEFWKMMKPKGGGALPGELEKRITADLGSVDAFKAAFVEAGVTQFGSGWCWLAVGADGKLKVTKTPNGESPMAYGETVLLGCDVWEHAYYIDYRNRRPDYVKAFLESMVNWEYVAERLAAAG